MSFLLEVSRREGVPAVVKDYITSQLQSTSTKQAQVRDAILTAIDNTATLVARKAAIDFLIGVAKDG